MSMLNATSSARSWRPVIAGLFDVAKTEQSVDLRAEAVQLGAMGAQEELSQLYQSETSPDVRKRIIQSMFAGHNEAKLIQLLRTETEEELRRSIVQNLGMMASPTSAEALTAVYTSDKNESVRRAVIDAFAQQRNSTVLVDLARKETDPAMKKRIVDRLSNMKSAEATDTSGAVEQAMRAAFAVACGLPPVQRRRNNPLS